MKTVKVLGLQSLFDIAIQNTGDVSNVFAIALANDKSITDELVIGESIKIPDGLEISSKALKYLTDREVLPSTAITIEQQEQLIGNSGIGTMKIGSTFIVR